MNKTNKNIKISIIVPTYKEKDNIHKLLTSIYKHMPKAKVVVVDDSPDDSTVDQFKYFLKAPYGVSVIRRKKKSGRGSAVIEGLKFALKKYNTDYYLEMDADLSHDPKELLQFQKLLSEKNIIVASRYIEGSKILNWPIERKVASRVSNLFIRIILSIPLNDNTNGYRAYSKSAIKIALKRKYLSKGHIVLSEMSYLLLKNEFGFVEFPSVFYNRRKGRSSANVQEFLKSLRDLVRIKFAIK